MLVLVVYIMWKTLLFYKLDLLYNDNLIKCEYFLKNKKYFLFDGIISNQVVIFLIIIIFN